MTIEPLQLKILSTLLFNEEPNTVRMILINVPARMIYRGRQWMLRLLWNYPYRKRWKKLEASIDQFNFV
jgi:hypothetical protein